MYILQDFPAVRFQGYTLMNHKLWGRKSGHGKENKAKEGEERVTLLEQARQLKADAEFQRKNQVGSWPQAKTVASTLPCPYTHTHAAADDTCSAQSSELWHLKCSGCGSEAAKRFSALLPSQDRGMDVKSSNTLVACRVEHSNDLIRTVHFLLSLATASRRKASPSCAGCTKGTSWPAQDLGK